MARSVQKTREALIAHLTQSLSDLRNIKDEWPEANEELLYPCLSIFQRSPTFTNLSPYQVTVTSPDTLNQVTSAWVVGMYDIEFQLDLWCENKRQRDEQFDKLFSALNPIITPMGLSLKLQDYYEQWARYDLVGHQVEDSEEESQRREWRATLKVRSNVREVLNRTDYGIVETQTVFETPDFIPEP